MEGLEPTERQPNGTEPNHETSDVEAARVPIRTRSIADVEVGNLPVALADDPEIGDVHADQRRYEQTERAQDAGECGG